ncbi:MAG: DUF732 domain-containing protein [Mycobacterium sp.]
MIGSKSLAATVAGAVVAFGIATTTGAGIASATPDDYLYDVNNNGIGGPRADLLRLGYNACSESRNAVPSGQSVAAISGATRLTPSEAQFVYESALMFLC